MLVEFKREGRIVWISNTLSLKLLAIWNVCLAFALVDTFARRQERRDSARHGVFLNTF